jgi:hypothetical protein
MKPKSHNKSDSVIIAGQSKLMPVPSGLDKPKYKLSDLLAECNQNMPIPPDLASWDIMPPVGLEIT